jgi:uncharacterized protein
MSAGEARRTALAAQGFGRAPGAAGTRQLGIALQRMAALQIDSVNVYARSHYMPLFSRLGAYDTALLDRMLFARRAPYVEYWAHVASFVAAADWPLFGFRMDEFRARRSREGEWAAAHGATLDWLRAELRDRGPLRPAQIESDSRAARRRGPWWDWDAVKLGLEHLWLVGEVAIAGRQGFERRYGLVEDVLPPEVAGVRVPREDAVLELVRRAARAYGVATAADLADYWRIRDRRAVLAAVHALVDAGELHPVTVEGWTDAAGRPLPAWRHADATIPRRMETAAILTPFDPVVWFRDRAERLFGFEYRIEIYTPAPKRRYGYYSLPVLVDDRIAGRVDLKADRAASRLLVQSAWWEPPAPSRERATVLSAGRVERASAFSRDGRSERVAQVLRDAARWQGLDTISVSRWGDATDDLAAVLPGASRHDAGAAEPVGLAPDEP